MSRSQARYRASLASAPSGARNCNVQAGHLYAVEIGSTRLGGSAQRTGINAEAKLKRSRQAIERLGAQFEGMLRSFSPSWAPGEEGILSNLAFFSVVAAEWPTVKSALVGLVARLAAAAATGNVSPGARRLSKKRHLAVVARA